MSTKSLKFKPYARLLTMLGDQLIRNEQVALSELVKNAYDADASWVRIDFENFDEHFRPMDGARIVVEDDGHGMTTEVIENHWVNPATPMKLVGKKGERRRTAKGRVIQGEKGIGRFALLKLGRDVTMTTRAVGSPSENVLKLELAKFDEDFLDADRAMFLDELDIQLDVRTPATTIVSQTKEIGARSVMRPGHGTRLEISPPIGTWTRSKVEKLHSDLGRLRSVFGRRDEPDGARDDVVDTDVEDFEVFIYRSNVYEPLGTDDRDKLDVLRRNNAVFTIEGGYDERERVFRFEIDRMRHELALSDPALTGLAVFREYLKRRGLAPGDADELATACGSFRFEFYVFDLSNDAKGRLLLEKPDKELIKAHRIYLYRDGIRVYPYGDPDDDWLLIDVRRGTVRASEFLSNDQVVGYVEISQAGNPRLRDKTSREGLVDTGQPVDDFRSLLQTFLAWVRKDAYARYKMRGRQSVELDAVRSGKVQSLLDEVVGEAASADVPSGLRERINEANKLYKTERRYLVQRAENTEHLAGVGLSVEAASHDLMLAMQRVMAAIDKLMAYSEGPGKLDRDALRAELLTMRGLLGFVQTQMADMQMLFRSTKQRRKDIRVGDLVEKVAKIFKSLLERHSIVVRVDTVGSPLVAKTTDAVLLQLLLNLFDNAVYWLQGSPQPREIAILLDGDAASMTFADNGPGFREEDISFVFEPFFTGKGEDGRGLGLYIARQLLERHEYAIDLAVREDRILPGANLVVSFVKEQA